MELYKHQKNLIEKLPEKYLVMWGTGMGKTVVALALIKNVQADAVIVCPKTIVKKWVRETEEFLQAENTIEHNDRYSTVYASDYAVHIVSKEYFRDKLKIEGVEIVIVDEAHYFCGMKSKMSKRLASFIKKEDPRYRWLLTATPFISNPWNIYKLVNYLGAKLDYWKFEGRFFYRVNMGGQQIPVVKKGIEEELAEVVNSFGEARRIEECVDIPPQVDEFEYMALTSDQKKNIKDIDKAEIMPIVRFTKHHQIANGILIGNEYTEDISVKGDKLQRIIEIVENTEGSIAIVCRYNFQIQQIKESLEKDHTVAIINGAVKDKNAVIEEVNKQKNAVVIINASCSEGYELPEFGTCIFASLSFSFKDYRQMRGRFLRINNMSKTVFIHLITEETIDEVVMENIRRKENFDIAIYARSLNS